MRTKQFLMAQTRAVGAAMLICGMLLGLASLSPTHSQELRASPPTPISHVVVFMLENHSFDNYFGQFPGVQNGATLTEASNPLPEDFDHSGPALAAAEHGGKMDEYPTRGQVGYTQSDIPIWWQYATQYGISDHFYSSIATNSNANHVAMVTSGNSGGMFDIVFQPGCGSPQNTLVLSRNTSANEYWSYPCYNITNNMPAELTSNGLSWRYYSQNDLFDAPEDIQSLVGSPNDIHNPNQFLTDIKGGSLANISWVVPSSGNTDHPPAETYLAQNWVSQQINAIMASSYWQNTAIFITWDDWAGLYDGVYPPQVDGTGLGERVPLIAISAYSKTHYISHLQGEFASFDHFIEDNWGLPTINTRDASASDLMDMFDFTQTPRAPAAVNPIVYNAGLTVPDQVNSSHGVLHASLTPRIGGASSTPYTYAIVYTGGGVPTTHNVLIDGHPHVMSDVGPVQGGEAYRYVTKLGVGMHTYTFSFTSPTGVAYALPYNSAPFPGPEVDPFYLHNIRVSSTVLPGKLATYSVTYVSPSNLPPTLAEVDIDGTPYTMTSSGGTTYQTGVTYTYTIKTLSIGEHYYRFRFSDGSQYTGVYEGQELPNVTPLALIRPTVSPTTGTSTTVYTFSITYMEYQGAAPLRAQIYIDGAPQNMTFVSGAFQSGALYQYSTALADGKHQFSFVFADSITSWAAPIGPAQYVGPTVSNVAQGAASSGPPVGSVIAPDHSDNPDYPLPPDYQG